MSEIIQAYVNAQNQTMEQVMQAHNETIQTPEQPEQAFVSAAYAQGLEVRIKELQDKLAQAETNKPNEFMNQLMAALDEHIEKKVEEIVEQKVEQLIEDKMTEHTDEYDHYEMEQAIERIDDKVQEVVEESVEQAINDFDFEDKINDVLRSATVTISV